MFFGILFMLMMGAVLAVSFWAYSKGSVSPSFECSAPKDSFFLAVRTLKVREIVPAHTGDWGSGKCGHSGGRHISVRCGGMHLASDHSAFR